MHRITFVLGLSALMVALVACDLAPTPRAVPTFAPRATSTPVSAGGKGGIVRVTRGSLHQTITARGRVNSVRESYLFFNIAGTISKISVAAGDQIKQGAPIAQLDAFAIEQDINLAKYEAERADLLAKQQQARVASYDYRIESAASQYTRYIEIKDAAFQAYRQKAPTPADHGRATVEYERFLRAEADALRTAAELNTYKSDRQIYQLDADLYVKLFQYHKGRAETLQARLKDAKLVAPLNGLVVSIDKNEGDPVRAFEPIGAIADPAQLQIEVSVPEENILAIALGQATRIILDGFPDREFSGKVKEIATKAAIFQGKNVYRVLIAFENMSQVPATLRMGADIAFVLQAKDDVLLVPTNALVPDGLQRYVTVLRNGKPERVLVQVGANGGNQTEILAGVVEDEQIVIP
ncbi:MAG: HlyD family efflux transporter periplasmic adaptor subunit [Chloroflexi bacterium]|nr:HlyD family efflux transporter periplasmic adaptor subunit [Chloroflexota bacterium]